MNKPTATRYYSIVCEGAESIRFVLFVGADCLEQAVEYVADYTTAGFVEGGLVKVGACNRGVW